MAGKSNSLIVNPYALFGLDPNSKDDDDKLTKDFKHALRRAQLLVHPDRWDQLPEEARNALPRNLSTLLNTAGDEIQTLIDKPPALGRSRWQAVRNTFGRGEFCYFWNPFAAGGSPALLRPPPGDGIERLHARTIDTLLPAIRAAAARGEDFQHGVVESRRRSIHGAPTGQPSSSRGEQGRRPQPEPYGPTRQPSGTRGQRKTRRPAQTHFTRPPFTAWSTSMPFPNAWSTPKPDPKAAPKAGPKAAPKTTQPPSAGGERTSRPYGPGTSIPNPHTKDGKSTLGERTPRPYAGVPHPSTDKGKNTNGKRPKTPEPKEQPKPKKQRVQRPGPRDRNVPNPALHDPAKQMHDGLQYVLIGSIKGSGGKKPDDHVYACTKADNRGLLLRSNSRSRGLSLDNVNLLPHLRNLPYGVSTDQYYAHFVVLYVMYAVGKRSKGKVQTPEPWKA